MILIDPGDGSRQLLDCPDLDGRCMSHHLDFGDAMLTGHGPGGGTLSVGVEVKSVSDLLSSLATGRLGGHQIPGLLASYDVCWIAIHGTARPGGNNVLQVRQGQGWKNFKIGKRPVPWAFLEGALMSYQLLATLQSKPLFVKWLYDLDEIACWLAVLDRWLEKPWEKHKALSVFDNSRTMIAPPGTDPVEEQMARTAASLPAIGWDRAWKAARHFDSVRDMLNAEEAEWKRIRGIGPIVARAVSRAVSAQRKPKKSS